MKIFTIICLIILLPTFAFCSTIIIFVNVNKIYIGADSKNIIKSFHINKSGKRVEVDSTAYACKINSIKDKWYCVDGYLVGDVTAAAKFGFSGKGKITQQINKTKAYLYNNIPLKIEYIRRHDPKNYKLISTNYFSQIAFFSFKNSVPYVYLLKIKRVNKPKEKAKIRIDMDIISNGQIKMFGMHEEVLKSMRKENYFLENGKKGIGVSETMVDLINREITAHPKDVGAPISVVELSENNQPYWSYHGVCK